ncbi:hypothetical protein E2C01_016960 [Portunus trituberculatus]|uniref:Uncharacterized protein n=1 Tax=Portunus trituberculatus TaxID=210409 RepID=A0A5B7DS48_PORTR|nr:hypothetical protein [Portunus trituberculatus]
MELMSMTLRVRQSGNVCQQFPEHIMMEAPGWRDQHARSPASKRSAGWVRVGVSVPCSVCAGRRSAALKALWRLHYRPAFPAEYL